MTQHCIFCRIVAREATAKVVYEDDRAVAFEDIARGAPLHVLVVPREHVESVVELADEALLGHLVAIASRVARDAGNADSGFRIVTNTGPDAGQAVPHLHFHVVAGRPLGPPWSRAHDR